MVLSRSENGEFYKASLDQPVQIEVGDEVLRDGNTITVVRAGVVVSVRTFGVASVASVVAQRDEVVSSVVFFRSKPVAGQSITPVTVHENPETGEITFRFSEGERQFASWAAMGTELAFLDHDPTFAQNALCYKSFVNSPDGTNKTTMIGVNCSVNFQAGTPFALIEV